MNDFTYKVTIRERDLARYMKDEDGVDKFINDIIKELIEKSLNHELRKYIWKHYGFNQEVFEEVEGVDWNDAEH